MESPEINLTYKAKCFSTTVPRLRREKVQFLQQMVLGKLDIYIQKNEVISYAKVNSN